MKKIIFLFVVAIVATTNNTYAQYVSDALRFSQGGYGSTARFKGMGNAQIGVGGDMSSLGGNPAGLGLFTKSEFSLTPEFNNFGANSLYLGENTNTTKSKLNLNQLGLVLYAPSYKQKGQNTEKGLLSFVYGIGYNRTNDFSFENNYGGKNNTTSIADYFAQIAGNTSPDKLTNASLEQTAYDNYLISYDGALGNYFPETFADANQGNVQRKNEVRSGSISEFNFAGAANISNQIYVGFSLGLVDIRYNSDSQFEESGVAREYNAAGALTGSNINYKLLFNQNQITRGSGVNGKLGVIFRPVSNFRIGATLQTPTWFVIDDSYTESLDNRGTIRGTSKETTYDFTYNLRTPLKGSLGASYVIGGQAIISADVDFIDYASMKLSSNDGRDQSLFMDNNRDIRDSYKGAVNYRLGAEYKIDLVNIRAGYGMSGSPYKSDKSGEYDTQMFSGGIGYRVNNYYLDLAYQRVEGTNNLSPYTLSNSTEPVANVKNTRDNVFLTFGLRF
jgi:hypothetical protein